MSKKSISSSQRQKLRELKERNQSLMQQLTAAAVREAEAQEHADRLAREKVELQRSLDFKEFQMNGFQLELQARHYELPFIAAQIESLLHGAKYPESVGHVLMAMKQAIGELMEHTKGHPPTLDPVTWVTLARKLGVSTNFQSRRTPVKIGSAQAA